MAYQYEATERFWRSFYSLSPEQKKSCRRAWAIFRRDPFDERLGTHRIASLSARAGETIYSVVVEPDLRVIFALRGGTVFTVDIGTHRIYR